MRVARPAPRPQADPALYGRLCGESRWFPWCPNPTPNPPCCPEHSDESTLTLTLSSITQHNVHDERNQFYFSTPSVHTLYIRRLTTVVSEHCLLHKRLRAASCSSWSDPANSAESY